MSMQQFGETGSRRFHCRKARPFDMAVIEEHLSANKLPTDDLASVLDHMFVAEIDGDPVAFGAIEVHGSYGLLRSLVTPESHRGEGYGQRLCQFLLDFAADRGVKEVYLLTETAVEFFKRFGFAAADRSDAPPVLQRTAEFASLCPDSAVCMRLTL